MRKYYCILLCLFICIGCGGQKIEIGITAKILSINTRILRGNWDGAFLSSSSGSIANDVNKIGVTFCIAGHKFFRDLTLNHAQTASLIVNSDIELRCIFESSPFSETYNLRLYYYGSQVCYVTLSEELAKQIEEFYSGR